MNRDTLLSLDRRDLRELLESGHPIDPAALEDTEYHGTSLGLPDLVVRLTWRKFIKTFQRTEGGLIGWNAKVVQDGLDAPWTLALRDGRPITYWHYAVRPPQPDERIPYDARQGLIIDYSLGSNPTLDTIRFARDPLVALHPGKVDLLLGVSWVHLGPLALPTPTWFCLERGGPLSHSP